MTGLTPLETARSITELGGYLEHFITTEQVESEEARQAELLSLCDRVRVRARELSTILAGEGRRDCEPSSSAGSAPSPAEATCAICRKPQAECDEAVAVRLATPLPARSYMVEVVATTGGAVSFGPLVPRREAA